MQGQHNLITTSIEIKVTVSLKINLLTEYGERLNIRIIFKLSLNILLLFWCFIHLHFFECFLTSIRKVIYYFLKASHIYEKNKSHKRETPMFIHRIYPSFICHGKHIFQNILLHLNSSCC